MTPQRREERRTLHGSVTSTTKLLIRTLRMEVLLIQALGFVAKNVEFRCATSEYTSISRNNSIVDIFFACELRNEIMFIQSVCLLKFKPPWKTLSRHYRFFLPFLIFLLLFILLFPLPLLPLPFLLLLLFPLPPPPLLPLPLVLFFFLFLFLFLFFSSLSSSSSPVIFSSASYFSSSSLSSSYSSSSSSLLLLVLFLLPFLLPTPLLRIFR